MDCLGRTLARALSMVALTVLVAGTYATLVASPAAAQVVIVSAGDSYASGEGAADGSPSAFPVWRGDDTDGLAQPCHRSTLAGAAVAAAQLGGYKPVAFASVACTGSVTGATPPGGGSQGSGPQSLLGSGGQFATIKSRFDRRSHAVDRRQRYRILLDREGLPRSGDVLRDRSHSHEPDVHAAR